MEIGIILATFLLMVVLFLIIRIILGPLKLLTKFFVNSGIALVVLICINFLGEFVGIHLPVNPVSVISVGILGIPGLVLVAFLSFLFI